MQQDLDELMHAPDDFDALPPPPPERPVPGGLVNISMRREHIPRAIGLLLLLGVACLVINAAIAYATAMYVVSRPAQWAADALPTTAPLPTIPPAQATGVAQQPEISAATAAPTPTLAPLVVNNGMAVIGQDVRVGDARWKVIDAKDEGPQLDADPSQFAAEAKTSGKYIRVRFEVENLGTEQRQFNGVSLSDQSQQSYPSTSDVRVLTHIETGMKCGGTAFNPNAPRTCEVLFDVPTSAIGLKLVVGALDPYAGARAEVSLDTLSSQSAPVQPLATAAPTVEQSSPAQPTLEQPSASAPEPVPNQSPASLPTTTSPPSATQAAVQSQSTATTTNSNTYTIGQDVHVSDVRWKVLEFKDEGKMLKATSTNILSQDMSSTGKFVRVRYEVQNQNKDKLPFSYVEIVDQADRHFRASSKAITHIPSEEICAITIIEVNATKICQDIFEMPSDATHLVLSVGDLKLATSASALIILDPSSMQQAAPVIPTSSFPPVVPGSTTGGIGQDVRVGDVRWKVLEVKDEGQTLTHSGGSTSNVRLSSRGKFIRIRFEIENLSKAQMIFSDVEIVDQADRIFQPVSDIRILDFIPSEESCTLEGIIVNLPRTCQYIFEVATNASSLKLYVGDLQVATSNEARIPLDTISSQSAPIVPTSTLPTVVPDSSTATIGQDIRVGDVRWKVLDIKNEGQTLKAQPGTLATDVITKGNFIRLRFEVENVGKKPLSFLSLSLIDQQQRSFDTSSDLKVIFHIPVDELCGTLIINPNVPHVCQVIFDIPSDAKGLKLIVNDLNVITPKKAQITLNF